MVYYKMYHHILGRHIPNENWQCGGLMNFFQQLLAMTGNGIGLLVYAIIIGLFIMGVFRCVMPVVRTRGRLRQIGRAHV